MTENSKKIVFAFILIVAGALLLGNNLDIIELHIPYYLRRWYTIFIFIGLFLMMVRGKVGPGIFMLAFGGVFMLSDVFDVNVFKLWPIALIAVGLAILFRKRGYDSPFKDGEVPPGDDYIDELAAFSGPIKKIRSQNFRGGKITTVFGGTEIDLSESQLAEGRNVIDLFTLFGGSTIFVPQNWNVKIKVSPIFGQYTDERVGVENADPSRELIITGTVIFGGGEVKNKA